MRNTTAAAVTDTVPTGTTAASIATDEDCEFGMKAVALEVMVAAAAMAEVKVDVELVAVAP